MLRFVGAVDHALFYIITHLSHGECHLVPLPPFFCVLELPKFVSSLMRQAANFTASEKVLGVVMSSFSLLLFDVSVLV